MQPACCPPNVPFEIFTGNAKVMPLRVAFTTGIPVDLSACTEIVANLPNADGTFTQLKLSDSDVTILSPAVLGQFTVAIDAIDSAKLNVATAQNVDVVFTISGQDTTVRFYSALSVFETT